MKFLVTGGAGFIGSNIVEELIKRRYKVRVLDNFIAGKIENIKPFLNKIEVVKGDIRNDKDLRKALKGIDYCLHHAALRSVPRSVDDPVSTNDVNITGTLKLLMAAKEMKVKRVVYASSSSIYGDNKTPQVESMVPSPLSPYAVSKLAAEHYCRIYAKTFGLETVSLRYFNVFGPKQDPNSKYAAVIPIFIRAALNNEEVQVHGDGKQSRDFSYIDNVVNANILAALTPGISGEFFNVACHASNSLLDIIKIIENLTHKKMKVKHTPLRKGDVRKTCADISKVKKLMKYKPIVNFEEGMVKTFSWIKENN